MGKGLLSRALRAGGLATRTLSLHNLLDQSAAAADSAVDWAERGSGAAALRCSEQDGADQGGGGSDGGGGGVQPSPPATSEALQSPADPQVAAWRYGPAVSIRLCGQSLCQINPVFVDLDVRLFSRCSHFILGLLDSLVLVSSCMCAIGLLGFRTPSILVRELTYIFTETGLCFMR